MGNCGEVWVFDCEYDWEDVMGIEIGMKKYLLFSSRRSLSKKRLCIPAQLRRASPTPIRWIA